MNLILVFITVSLLVLKLSYINHLFDKNFNTLRFSLSLHLSLSIIGRIGNIIRFVVKGFLYQKAEQFVIENSFGKILGKEIFEEELVRKNYTLGAERTILANFVFEENLGLPVYERISKLLGINHNK